MKYVLFLLLCGGGCMLSMSGIGPGFVSMSPPRRRRRSGWVVLFVGVMCFCE